MTSNLLVLAAVKVHSLSPDPIEQESTWLEAAGLPQPLTVRELLRMIDAQPKPHDVLVGMIEGVTALDEEWLEDHLGQFQRASQFRAMYAQLETLGRQKASRRLVETLGERFALLDGPISGALVELEAAVDVLPEGERALRPEANIDAGTTEELASVRSLLSRIGTMLGALNLERGTPRLNQWVTALLDVPEIRPARVPRFGKEPTNPSPARDAIRALSQVEDVDQMVVDVLRGHYQPLRLRLVRDRAEYRRRCGWVHAAHVTEIDERTRP